MWPEDIIEYARLRLLEAKVFRKKILKKQAAGWKNAKEQIDKDLKAEEAESKLKIKKALAKLSKAALAIFIFSFFFFFGVTLTWFCLANGLDWSDFRSVIRPVRDTLPNSYKYLDCFTREHGRLTINDFDPRYHPRVTRYPSMAD